MNSNRKSYSWQRVNCSYEKGLYMRIERVESLDKRKCKVFTDEDFAFLLYNGELEKYGVCEGAVLEERTERELLDLLSRRAHERALNLLKVQDRTEGEMCRRLFQDGYPDSIVQETIGFLQEYHFVDDARYAANYLQVHGKRKSQAELKLYLQRKGISREIIREQLEEMEDRESLCTIFFSADARPEFQQLLEKFRKEKREFIWFCPVNRIIRPEINAGIRPYTRLIDVEEGGRL